MKKLLALLLALAMMICLVACGEEKTEAPKEEGAQQEDKAPAADQGEEKEEVKEDEKKEEAKKDDADLEGTWECEMNYAEFLDKLYVAAGVDESILPNEAITYYMELVIEDGKIVLNSEIDEDELDAYFEALTENLTEYLYAESEKQGLSKEEADAKSKEDNDGKTVPEYAASLAAEDRESITDLKGDGDPEYYKVEDGKIYTAPLKDDLDDSKTFFEFELDGDELTFEGYTDDGEETDDPFGFGVEEFQFPWVFTK